MTQSNDQVLVYDRTDNWFFKEITVTYRLLKVLSCIEDSVSFEDIAEKLDVLTHEEISAAIEELIELELVTVFSFTGMEETGLPVVVEVDEKREEREFNPFNSQVIFDTL